MGETELLMHRLAQGWCVDAESLINETRSTEELALKQTFPAQFFRWI